MSELFNKERFLVTRQIQILLENGWPLDRAIKTLSEKIDDHEYFNRLVNRIQ